MRKHKPIIIGSLLLLSAGVLMHAFAYTAEDIRVLYRVIEVLGLYNSELASTHNLLIWVILIILICVFIFIAGEKFESAKHNYRFPKLIGFLPLLAIMVSLASCWLAPRTHIFILSFQNGIDGVIMDDRDSILTNLKYDEYGNPNGYGDPDGFAFSLDFKSFASKDVSFYVKLIDLDDENCEYICLDNTNQPKSFSLGSVSRCWDREFPLHYYNGRSSRNLVMFNNVMPGFVVEKENWSNTRFKVVIYNKSGSKTFYLYDKYKTGR